MDRIRAWIRAHKVWSTVIAVVVVLFAIGITAPDEDTASDGDSASAGAEEDASGPGDDAAAEDESADDDESEPATKRNSGRPPTTAPAPTTRTPKTTPQPTPKPKRKLWPVVSVADGDTVTVAFKGREESIRIIGIDTPETVDPNTPDECWGERASAAAHRMLEGREVALVFDPTQGRRDAYDRLLAYVEIPGTGDFGLAQLRRGNAVEYTYDTPYQRQATYQAAERRAAQADRGLWPVCGGADKPLRQPSAPRPRKAEPPPATGRGSGAGDCAAGYQPCVPPGPPDLDCADVDGPIRVSGDDPHGLDRDGDGVACES